MNRARALFSISVGIVLLAGASYLDASGHVSPQVGPRSRAAIQVAPTMAENARRQAAWGWWVGTLEQLTADSLYLRLDKEEQARGWLRESVLRLRVTAGTKGHAGLGTLLGGLIGIPVGIGVASTQKKPTGWLEMVSSAQVTAFMVSWFACTLVGAVIGSNIRSERWQDVDLTTLPPMPDSSRAVRQNE